ncbi:uncharacterized protein BP5553_06656 [Venustampulla echinocandica]|uniref:SAM domain-containing protein n=1 Tax=Venustampulla echinocandica TaxID=2656787 RepID=A0A370TKJ8_9HELO|nr:uncharacterized protein BP5553_06656 [Venustampulla echinocandica]RDL36044.1 hypothetical protein BP5553_06656 [Venustampulla echinocandica]
MSEIGGASNPCNILDVVNGDISRDHPETVPVTRKQIVYFGLNAKGLTLLDLVKSRSAYLTTEVSLLVRSLLLSRNCDRAMAFDISQLLNRLGLSHCQQRLAENGFDSLECLYGITENDFETLDIERGDRRTLQQELRRREAQNSSRGLAALSAHSLWHGTPGTKASAMVSNDESAVALRHPELEPTRRSEPAAWGYLINPATALVQRLCSTRSGHP